MKNKYLCLITSVALLATACSTNPPIDQNCGQVANTVLSGFASNRVGPADVKSVNTLLTNFNSAQSWHSTCEADIVAVPGGTFWNAERNLYCRNLTLRVDGRQGNLVTCLSDHGWSVISSDLKQVKVAPIGVQPKLPAK